MKKVENQVGMHSSIQSLRERRKIALNDNNKVELFKVYSDLFYVYLNDGEFSEALYYLWKGLSVMEYIQDIELKEQLLEQCLIVLPFIHEIDEYRFLIEANIAIERETSYGVLSLSYYLLSVIYFNRLKMNEAYSLAKMAYYFASKLPKDEQEVYLCNVRIQLTYIALFNNDFTKVDEYIEKFGWHIADSKNEKEKVLNTFIHLSYEYLKGKNVKKDILLLLEQFTEKQEIVYTTYLAMKLYLNTQFKGDEQFKQQVANYYDQIKEHFTKETKDFFSKFALLRKRIGIHSEYFFERAEAIFQNTKQQGRSICLVKFIFKQGYNFCIDELLNLNYDIDFVTHHYRDGKFILVFDIKDILELHSYFEKQSNVIEVLGEAYSEQEHTRFFDVYNILNLQIAL